MQEERALPRSLEAERAVLGGLMLDPQRVPLVSEHLQALDFYRESHQKLFELMVRMTERDEPTEMVAVVEQISKTGEAEAFGGLSYVSALPDNVPSLENLEYYAKLVRERAVARRLIFAAQGITSAVLDGKEDLTDLLDKAESSIFEVTQSNEQRDWVALSQVVDSEFLRIQELSENPKDVTGCTTGYKLLDDMLSGFQPSELVILAARPSMGKTALALNIAQNAAMEGGVGVGVFSLEMSAEQLGTRLLCSHARIDAGKVRTGQLTRDEDWPKLVQAAEELYQVPIFVDDTPALTVNQIRSKARRLATQQPDLGLIVIDYIGMMAGDPRVSRQEQVSASSRGLKALAKELGIPVLCL